MTYCGIGGFSSLTEVAGMAGFMTAVSLLLALVLFGAIAWAGRSLYEITMGEHGRNWLGLALGLIGMLAMGSLLVIAGPQAVCLWGAA